MVKMPAGCMHWKSGAAVDGVQVLLPDETSVCSRARRYTVLMELGEASVLHGQDLM
jgi:hypothetical protein